MGGLPNNRHTEKYCHFDLLKTFEVYIKTFEKGNDAQKLFIRPLFVGFGEILIQVLFIIHKWGYKIGVFFVSE